MNTRLLRDSLLAIAFWDRCCRRNTRYSATVPDTPDVVAGYDLRKTTCLHMPDFDEPTVEQEDVWRMPCDMLRSAFPLDGTVLTTGVAMPVNV